MSISTTNLSSRALLAGIVAIADAIGPNCRDKACNAIVQAQRLEVPPADAPIDLRDRFAGSVMAAIYGNTKVLETIIDNGKRAGLNSSESIAAAAYEMSDAMLAARGAV